MHAPIYPGSPCVAVVVPAYNAEATIGKAVSSALAQAEVAEIVVVDDGSSDATAAVALSCDDGTRRLRVVRQPNAGVSAACNKGVSLTRAPVWTILDADDSFAPQRLSSLLERAGSEWELAADAVVFRFPDGGEHRLCPSTSCERIDLERFVRGNIPQRKRPRTELGYLQPLKKRSFFDAVGLRFDPSIHFAEDYIFYARALALGARFLWANGPGYIANVTPGSLSHTQTAADYERVIAFDRDLLPGRAIGEASALRSHIRAMRLKAKYLRIEQELNAGRRGSGWRLACESPRTASYVFNNRYRPVISKALKRLLGLDSGAEFFPQNLRSRT